ncbi:dUTP diphosphatase [Candidatus Saccharibacteria bacterium HGW-Saccharibacteria-1]|jgi:dUTP pyrophosphatase|nr:MAG: dUTP diphosphatase [Candidatus Saccharibacteria bacterium HGW-Saccharibacteria-1]
MAKTSINIVKLKENAIIPSYQTEQAAGMDLHACIDEPIVLGSLERVMIPTGFAIELPAGFEAQIRARSGMSIKYGITMVNGIGTVDADYRGEVGVLAINLSKEPFTIEPGMRVAQMVIAKYECIDWSQVGAISETDRGTGGYGSTGVNS